MFLDDVSASYSLHPRMQRGVLPYSIDHEQIIQSNQYHVITLSDIV